MKVHPLLVAVLAALVLAFVSSDAFASSIPGVTLAGAGPMPWDRPLGMAAAALTGTTGKIVGLIGIVIIGYKLIFGEGHSGGMFKAALGISLVVGAGHLISLFFQGGAGAVL